MPSAIISDVVVPQGSITKMAPPQVSFGKPKVDCKALETAHDILATIYRYRLSHEDHQASGKSDEGDLKFVAQLYSKVKAGRQINMCLPAFPFKSPNSVSKVLGYLPDKSEEIALAHLNGLCDSIKTVYPPGAELTIISDGLVYNDLLSVPDKNVWAYGEGLRAMSVEKELANIKFNRLKDLVNTDFHVPDDMDELAYVANATNFRSALITSFGKRDYDADHKIQTSEDTCLTYRGYLRFLETDLQTIYPINEERSKKRYKKGLGYIAKQMLFRGDAFARAVAENFSDHLRLSIHPSNGEKKISISLLPTDSYYTTPWHSSLVCKLDGTITSGLRSDFESDPKLELVYEHGRPSYFREKSELLSFAEDKGGVTCEPIYPSGFLIKPAAGHGKLSIHDIDAAKVRALSEINSPVVLRDFSKTTHRDLFVAKAEQFGTIQPWKFGTVLEVKDGGANTAGLNNVLSAEWMPFHYDGLFKTEKHDDDLVSLPPRFQFFTGVTNSPKTTGYTLFATSTMIFKYLPEDLDINYLRKLTWSVNTTSFDETKLHGLPLIVDHPTTGRPCLRYHEPWPQSKTAFEPTHVSIQDEFGTTLENSEELCAVLDGLLHDRRVAYWHSWCKGDLVVSDNTAALHTRSDFTAGCDRELWRIHFN